MNTIKQQDFLKGKEPQCRISSNSQWKNNASCNEKTASAIISTQ